MLDLIDPGTPEGAHGDMPDDRRTRRRLLVGLAVAATLTAALAARHVTHNSTADRVVVTPQSITGWQSCSNIRDGYVISVPNNWHAWTATRGSCSLFDPSPLGRPRPFSSDWALKVGDHPVAALQVAVYPSSFEHVVAQISNPAFEATLSRRSTRVAGHRTVVLETRATGDGAYKAGARAYWYVIERGGNGFVVSTVADARRADRYAEFKSVVDHAARSIVFRPSLNRLIGFVVLGIVALIALAASAIGLRRRRASPNRDD